VIWAVPIKYAPQVEPDVMAVTVKAYCIGEGRTPLFLFGIVPTNLALRSGFIWIHLLNRPSATALRLLSRNWPAFREKLGWNLLAFCETENRTARRFIEFFRFALSRADDEHAIYSGVK
jgi:hypothetical protein